MIDRINQKIGGYRLVRLLSRSSFADVYLGEHGRDHTWAVIKIFHTSLSKDDADTFRKEANTLVSLKHQHIVSVSGFSVQSDGTPYLVTNYTKDDSLRKHYPPGTIVPISTVVAYVKQIASALQYAHDRGVTHQNIKSENILLGQNDELLLYDFNIPVIASHIHMRIPPEQTDSVYYMSPEYLHGNPQKASDQYALGVVVYEWLSGQLPFAGDFSSVKDAHLHAIPPPLPAVSPIINNVIQIALHKNFEQRYICIADFADALEKATGQTGSPKHQASFFAGSTVQDALPNQQQLQHVASAQKIPKIPKFSRRSILQSLLTGVTGGVLLVAWVRLGSRVPQIFANTSTPVVTPTHILSQTPTSTPTPTPTASPTGNSRGTTILYYFGHSSNVNGIAWSPDSKYIASASFDGTVQIWDARTGDRFTVYSGHKEPGNSGIHVNDVAWSQAGNYIVSCSNAMQNQIHVWDARTGRRYAVFNRQTSNVNAVVWSMNASYIASASFDGSVTGWAWDSIHHQILNPAPSFTYPNSDTDVASKVEMFDVAWSPDSKYIAASSTYPDQVVHVLYGTTGSLFSICRGHIGDVLSVAWSPNSSYIVSGSTDKTARIWNTYGEPGLIYQGHRGAIRRVAWSPDPNSNLVASGCWNGEIHLWDATSGKLFFNYQDHQKGINALAWSPDGTMIASGGFDNTVRVWTTGLTGRAST